MITVIGRSGKIPPDIDSKDLRVTRYNVSGGGCDLHHEKVRGLNETQFVDYLCGLIICHTKAVSRFCTMGSACALYRFLRRIGYIRVERRISSFNLRRIAKLGIELRPNISYHGNSDVTQAAFEALIRFADNLEGRERKSAALLDQQRKETDLVREKELELSEYIGSLEFLREKRRWLDGVLAEERRWRHLKKGIDRNEDELNKLRENFEIFANEIDCKTEELSSQTTTISAELTRQISSLRRFLISDSIIREGKSMNPAERLILFASECETPIAMFPKSWARVTPEDLVNGGLEV